MKTQIYIQRKTNLFMKKIIYLFLSLMIIVGQVESTQAQNQPNILVVITDDMGVDAMSWYGIGEEQPNTPNLDNLKNEGILFNNAWGYAKCSPSRATILTGRYGSKNGVIRAGPDLPLDEVTIFEHIDDLTDGAYADALFGKWHLGDEQSPNLQGVDHFVGYMG